MDLFWSVDHQQDLYMNNLCRAWDDALEDFNYHPLIRQDAVESMLTQVANLEDVDVYIAGPKDRVERAGEKLLAAGLPHEQLKITAV